MESGLLGQADEEYISGMPSVSVDSEKKRSEGFRREAVAILLWGVALFLTFALLSYHPGDPSLSSFQLKGTVKNWCGVAGSFLADFLLGGLGYTAWVIPAVLVLSGVAFIREGRSAKVHKWAWGWSLPLILSLSGLVQKLIPEPSSYLKYSGGWLGWGLQRMGERFFNHWGLLIILVVTFVFSLIFLFQIPLVSFLIGLQSRLFKAVVDKLIAAIGGALRSVFEKQSDRINHDRWVKPIKPHTSVPQDFEETADNGEDVEPTKPLVEKARPKSLFQALTPKKSAPSGGTKVGRLRPQKVENWSLPSLDLLSDPPAGKAKVDVNEIRDRMNILLEKLQLFGVTGEVVASHSGPAVTLFEFKPERSVKISKITELADDLAMALSSESLRIIAPIPGRDVVGIETSNRKREIVYLKELLLEKKFWDEEVKLPIALGKKVDGTPEVVDLRKMPHLLVAGTTGSGKSVFTVSLIAGLLFRHSPSTLRVILVDPKQVDLTVFENIPHLALPIVTEARQAVMTLKWAVGEMEKRYRSMSVFGARGLEAYNEIVAKLSTEEKQKHAETNAECENLPGEKHKAYYFEPLPYLLIVVEEFADLMSVDKGNVELSVIRLAQKARACGIHLVLCLQSPRKEFVTGAIKSNIPSRIAFKTASSMESRIILDEVGAERLLASGDMLYRGPGSANIVRHHGPFLPDEDIRSLTQFWRDQGQPKYVTNIADSNANEDESSEFTSSDLEDEKLQEILAWVRTQKEVSASLIQRRFSVGYPRAARIIETLEQKGWVGPANGSKPRQVLLDS